MDTKKSKFLVSFIFLIFSIITSAASNIDNQTVIPKEWKSFFSAKPLVQNVQTSNSNHQILIGIFDSGVDYNNPYLQSKVHYSLNPQGQIIGAGIDYIKNDSWPLPYVAKTRFLYNKNADAQKEHQDSDKFLKQILTLDPSLAYFLNGNRNLESEAKDGMYHGTHVAGLASYDDNRIGIVPFRIMPQTEDPISTTSYTEKNQYLDFMTTIKKAISDAAKLNVKIINISITFSFQREDFDFDKYYASFKEFENIVKANPQIVFVAASGNDNNWSDGGNRFSFPCGVNATNMLCVAGLDSKGNILDFSNIPLVDAPIIYAPGESIISTMPTYYCESDEMAKIQSYGSDFEIGNSSNSDIEKNALIAEEAKRITAQLEKDCSNEKSLLGALSGTSFSTPLIARLLAQKALSLGNIDQLSGTEIITQFLKDAVPQKIGPLSILKMRAPKPSWYKITDSDFVSWSQNPSGFFEFSLKKQ